jgi:hypothetical protein
MDWGYDDHHTDGTPRTDSKLITFYKRSEVVS